MLGPCTPLNFPNEARELDPRAARLVCTVACQAFLASYCPYDRFLSYDVGASVGLLAQPVSPCSG